MKQQKILRILGAITWLTASSVSAGIVAQDPFDGGTVFNGGTGWTGDWSSGIYAGSNLTYGALNTSGAGANIDGYWTGESTRSLTTAQTTGTVWMSWIQNSGGTTGGNPNQMRILNSGGSRLFTIGQHFDGNTFKIYDTDFNVGANSGVAITGTHLVAMSIDLAANLVTLYIDPVGLGVGAAPTSAASAVWDGPGSIANIGGIKATGGGDAFAWDEVRVGTTWADVSPATGGPSAAPSSLAATSIVFSEANLTWVDNSADEFQFVIERSPDGTTGWLQVGTAVADSTDFSNTGLAGSTTYYYRVLAKNGIAGATYSNVTSVTTPSANPTPPPTDLIGVADSFSEITLSWTDNTPDETGFLLERSPDGTTGWTPIATLAPDVTSYQDIGLAAATTYYYRTTALVTENNSLPSNVASATTPVLPAPVALSPIYLPFEDATDTELNLAVPPTGFSAFTGSGFVRTTSALSYPGLTAPLGNGLETVTAQRSYLSIDTTLPGLANYMSGGQIGGSGLGVLYVRWLAKGINANEANTVDFLAVVTDPNNTSRASVGTTFSNNFIRAMSATTSTSGIDNYVNSALTPSAGTDLYVARFTFSPSGVNTMDLFVNQLTEGTPDVTATGAIVFNTIAFSKFGPAAVPSIDEFRIATSWAQAVDASGASAYTTWASGTFANPFTNTGATVDFDLDGITNLMEFVLGGDPTINDTPSIRPAAVASGSDLVLTFKRSDASELQPVAVKVQVSSDLVTWNPADDIIIGAIGGSGPNGATYTVDDTGTLDTVVVTLPKGAATKKFVRVHAQD